MLVEHVGLNQISGSLVVLDGVEDAFYEEMVELRLDDGSTNIDSLDAFEYSLERFERELFRY